MKILNRHEEGSFTLEAAVIVPLVMLILTSVVFMGMYLYDSVTIAAVSDYAVLSSIGKKGSIEGTDSKIQSLLEGKMIAASGIRAFIEGNNKKITAAAHADVNIPLKMIRNILGNGQGNVSSEIVLSNINGREVLILYKSIIDGITSVLENGTQ